MLNVASFNFKPVKVKHVAYPEVEWSMDPPPLPDALLWKCVERHDLFRIQRETSRRRRDLLEKTSRS